METATVPHSTHNVQLPATKDNPQTKTNSTRAAPHNQTIVWGVDSFFSMTSSILSLASKECHQAVFILRVDLFTRWHT
jgi:hypothetical protein